MLKDKKPQRDAGDDDLDKDAELVKKDISHFKKLFEADADRARKLLKKHFPDDDADELYDLLKEADGKSDEKESVEDTIKRLD